MPPARPPLGAHVSVAGGHALAIGRGMEMGCEAIQIFVKNPNQWRSPPLEEEDAAAFRQAREAGTLGPVVAHASYLVNLAATDETVLRRSRQGLAEELERCASLGVDALVVHPGAHRGAGEAAGLAAVADSLREVLEGTSHKSRLLLENTAGQGTALGHRLEQLAEILEATGSPKRLGVCLDTCHAFAAGYPLHEPQGYEDFVRRVDASVGLEAVACFHLNDSRRRLGSRRDRHANLGEGEMGLGPFRRLLSDQRFQACPMILETPGGSDQEGHRRDLARLRSLLPEVDRGGSGEEEAGRVS